MKLGAEELEIKSYLLSNLKTHVSGKEKSKLIFTREEEQPARFKLRVRAGQSMAIRAEKRGRWLGWDHALVKTITEKKRSRAGLESTEHEWGSRGS